MESSPSLGMEGNQSAQMPLTAWPFDSGELETGEGGAFGLGTPSISVTSGCGQDSAWRWQRTELLLSDIPGHILSD